MGLTDALSTYAVRGAHVLVVEVPGSWPLRAAMERTILEQGWRLASAPADADVLAVCGRPGPQLAEAVDNVWDQLPGPRVRIGAKTEAEAVTALDRAAVELSDTSRHRRDARQRSASRAIGGDHMQMDPDMDADMHMDEDMHMDMDAGMDMDMAPEGIPLAGGAEDRDGLEMDVLHLRLGPVLRYWPAGLVLRCTLQGDVIVHAEAEMIDAGRHAGRANNQAPADSPLLRAARWCDNITSITALAGWQDAASRTRRVRDLLLTERDADSVAAAVDALARKIRRSRLLRWALSDIGVLTADKARQLRLPSEQTGDAWDRLLMMLERANAELSTETPEAAATGALMDGVAAVPHLVEGLELETARLVVASLGQDSFAPQRQASHD